MLPAVILTSLILYSQPNRAASPAAEAGTEFSRAPDVSITRYVIPGGISIRPEDADHYEKGWDIQAHYPGIGNPTFTSIGSFLWTVRSATRLRKELIIGSSLLPRGTYTVKVVTKGGIDQEMLMKQVQTKLFQALEHAFNLRVFKQNRKLQVLVLSKGANWNRDGFKTSWWGLGPWGAASKDGRSWDFGRYDMEGIAGAVEGELERIVLNETGIQGHFSGNMAAGQMQTTQEARVLKLADVQKDLVKHGLRLQEAIREMDVVVIEKKTP